MTSAFQTVPLEQLRESPLNPRQHFGAAALEELTNSVKTKGILVPLLVRPVDGHFEIVAGARRFRAAQAAALTEVPVFVRELDDDQALEAAVIENLQREDVHPLEEALGYTSLMERVHYDVDGIAAKIGKSVSYVYQRLQLLKLIEPLRTFFLDNELTAGHAVELARLTIADQQALLKDERDGLFEHEWVSSRHKRIGPISVRALRHLIERSFHLDLARAPWDLTDAGLVKAAGPCLSCPKRTGANPALFPDVKKTDTCTDRACYELKQHRTAEQKQAQFLSKGTPAVLISDEYSYSGNDTKRLAAAGILPHNQYGSGDGWRDAGKQKCPHLAKGIVSEGREIGAVKSVCTKPGTCRVHGMRHNEQTGSMESRATNQKRQREQHILNTARRRTLDAVLAKISHPLSLEDLRAIVLHDFRRLYNPLDRDIVKALGWLPPSKGKGARPDHDRIFLDRLATLSAGELGQMAVRIVLWADTNSGPLPYGGATGLGLSAFATRYKVDAARIAHDVRAEEKAKDAAKPKKRPVQTSVKPAGGQQPASRPKTGTCRVCGCTDGKPCPEGCGWADKTHAICTSCTEPAPVTSARKKRLVRKTGSGDRTGTPASPRRRPIPGARPAKKATPKKTGAKR